MEQVPSLVCFFVSYLLLRFSSLVVVSSPLHALLPHLGVVCVVVAL